MEEIWQCKEGHVWETTPTNIKRGKWCPTCARISRINRKIEKVNDLQSGPMQEQ